jgi:hypothetical protein
MKRVAALLLLTITVGCGDDGDAEGLWPARTEPPADSSADAGQSIADGSVIVTPQFLDASGPVIPAPDSSSAPPSTSPGVTRFEGLYWFKETYTTTSYGPGGTVSQLPTLAYYIRMFQPNGYAWVGAPRPEDQDMVCAGPSETASGRKECAAYNLANGTLTVQVGTARPWPITQHKEGWMVGAYLYRPVPSFAGLQLSGAYEYASCSGVSCRQGMVTLESSGRYTLGGSAATLVNVSNTSLTAAVTNSNEGRYTIGAHSIQFQPTSGVPTKYFFLLDRSSSSEELIVIGDTWYLKR